MSTDRDTHFAGFAKLLWDELLHVNEFGYIEISDDEEEENKRYEQIIARRAYDLVEHSVRHTGVQQYDPATGYASGSSAEVIARDIPDLTEWPVEQDE